MKNKRHGLYVMPMNGMSNSHSWLITSHTISGMNKHAMALIADENIIENPRCLLLLHSLKYVILAEAGPDIL